MTTPPLLNTPIWTYVLTSQSLTFTVADNIKILALNCLSGTVNVTGGQQIGRLSLPSGPIQLSTTNQNLTIGGEENPISLVTVDATSGSVQLVAYF